MDDGIDRRVEKVAVVADDDHGARVAGEIALQPHRAFQVEIVGRLVEEQEVRLGEEDRGERDAHPPAAGKVRAGPLLRRGVEAEALAGCARRAPPPRARRYRRDGCGSRRSGADRSPFPPRRGGRHARGRPPARCREATADPPGASCSTRPMRVALRHADRAAVRRDLAHDGAEERGLAGAVPADEADLGALRHEDAGPLDEGAAGDAKRQIVDLQHGRGFRRGWRTRRKARDAAMQKGPGRSPGLSSVGNARL